MKVDHVVSAPQNPSKRYSKLVIVPLAINPIKNDPDIFTIKMPIGNLYLGRNKLSIQNLSGAPIAAPIEKSKRFITVLQILCAL